jgi:hypothetical protein
MAEKDKIFSSKIKYNGIVNFANFYGFCYDWLKEETGLDMVENKYTEKLGGDSKNIEVEWSGSREITDYFKFEAKVTFKVIGLTNVEITEEGRKVKTNKGSVELAISGTIVRDHKGKFERTGFQKFIRGIYEKNVIPERIGKVKEKIMSDCDEFLSQAKSYLDLEGKR